MRSQRRCEAVDRGGDKIEMTTKKKNGARSPSPLFFFPASAASPSAAPSTVGAQSNTPASRTRVSLPPERRLEATSSRSEASEAEEEDD